MFSAGVTGSVDAYLESAKICFRVQVQSPRVS